MIRFDIKSTNYAEVTKALERFGDNVRDQLKGFLKSEGAEMEKEVKQSMSTGGRSRSRGPRGGKLVSHSAPGEPPFVQSGRLRASIGYRTEVSSEKNFWIEVGAIRGGKAEVKYARRLEFGGSDKRGVYIAPRPYLFPVIMRRVPNWPKALKVNIISSAVRKA